jgi:hypothetical protein
MMPLHQDLESGFDIGALGVGFKAEHVERAALGVEDFAALLAGARAPGRLAVVRCPPIEPIFQVGRWPVRSSF